MKNNKYTKKISGLLIISIIFVNFSFLTLPKKSGAFWGVGDATEIFLISDPGTIAFYSDTALLLSDIALNTTESALLDAEAAVVPSLWDMARKLAWEPLLQSLAKIVARSIIQNIVEATVAWINSGFQGNPAYVSDPAKFLTNTGDQVVGEMLFNDPDLNFLCAPFQLQVKIALGLGISQPFYRKINCTLTGAMRNSQNAVDDLVGNLRSGNFIEMGGWKNWMQSSQPQNNPVGAYLMAKSELDLRTQVKKASVSAQLNWGSGALDFQKCKDTTYNINYDENDEMYEEQAGEREYFGSPSHGLDADGNPSTKITGAGSANEQRIETTCETKTPGAIVTDMLGFKATSDARTLELQAALANGIDQILNALVSQLLKMALNQLAEGVLGSSDSDGDYKNSLAEQIRQAQISYNNQINNINTQPTSSPFDISPSINSYDTILDTDDTDGYTYSQGFNRVDPSLRNNNRTETTDPLAKPREEALLKINSLNDSEIAYQNILIDAENMLKDASEIFTVARDCNTTTNTPTSILKAYLIDSNIITNIDGIVDPYRTFALIPWNLKYLNEAITASNKNIEKLSTARTLVTGATTYRSIVTAMRPIQLSSESFNKTLPTEILQSVKDWLAGVSGIYSTNQCPINIGTNI